MAMADYSDQPILANALECIRRSLDEYLFDPSANVPSKVVLSNLIDPNGKSVPGTQDKIVMILASIFHETTISTFTPTRQSENGDFVTKSPPLYVGLYVVFYANMTHSNYEQGLSAISSTISYFQQNPSFTQQTIPDLNPAIERLTFEFKNVDLLDWNHVVGMLGVNYMPSVMYKVRLLPFDGRAIGGRVPAVEGLRT